MADNPRSKEEGWLLKSVAKQFANEPLSAIQIKSMFCISKKRVPESPVCSALHEKV